MSQGADDGCRMVSRRFYWEFRVRTCWVVLITLMLSVNQLSAQTTPVVDGPESDAFLAGYVTAVLERELQLYDGRVTVQEGHVTVAVEHAGERERNRIAALLARVRGVKQVTVIGRQDRGVDAAGTQPAAALLAINDQGRPEASLSRRERTIGPRGRLFQPLLADPRWPHMSASYLHHSNQGLARNVGAANLGGDFIIGRKEQPGGSAWEVGLQAGVFSVFDMDADSTDLLNADYLFAVSLAHRRGDWSALLRLGHLSAHVGDELLLKAPPDFVRENYSNEWIDLLVSRDLFDGQVRLYGGGRLRIGLDPSDLERWSIQYGVEWQSPMTYFDGFIRPVAALDMQHHEQTDWQANLSLRAGVQIEDPALAGNVLQILAEYYNGHSFNGQFFDDQVEYYGLGVHFYY